MYYFIKLEFFFLNWQLQDFFIVFVSHTSTQLHHWIQSTCEANAV